MKMTSCSSFPMIVMKTCHFYQAYIVRNIQELSVFMYVLRKRNQLHDILTIMTRSMAKTKQTDVPSIYPLKGEHKKPEHVKQVNIDKEEQEPNRNVQM